MSMLCAKLELTGRGKDLQAQTCTVGCFSLSERPLLIGRDPCGVAHTLELYELLAPLDVLGDCTAEEFDSAVSGLVHMERHVTPE